MNLNSSLSSSHFRPRLFKGFFRNDGASNIRAHVLKKEFVTTWDNQFNREFVHNPPFLVNIHIQLVEIANLIFGESVKPSYSFLSLYGENGICPEHTDRSQ